jgi:hypothetical protein
VFSWFRVLEQRRPCHKQEFSDADIRAVMLRISGRSGKVRLSRPDGPIGNFSIGSLQQVVAEAALTASTTVMVLRMAEASRYQVTVSALLSSQLVTDQSPIAAGLPPRKRQC